MFAVRRCLSARASGKIRLTETEFHNVFTIGLHRMELGVVSSSSMGLVGAERALLYETRRYYYYYYFAAGATRLCHFPVSVRYRTIAISDA